MDEGLPNTITCCGIECTLSQFGVYWGEVHGMRVSVSRRKQIYSFRLEAPESGLNLGEEYLHPRREPPNETTLLAMIRRFEDVVAKHVGNRKKQREHLEHFVATREAP